MKEAPCYYVIFDPETGKCLEVLDSNCSCHPYVGMDYAGHCGGCDKCLLMQADHQKFEIKHLVLQEYETVGDAVGRLVALRKESHV